MSEFGGLRKCQNNPACTRSARVLKMLRFDTKQKLENRKSQMALFALSYFKTEYFWGFFFVCFFKIVLKRITNTHAFSNPTNTGTVSKAMSGKLLRDKAGHIQLWAFLSTLISPWTELSSPHLNPSENTLSSPNLKRKEKKGQMKEFPNRYLKMLGPKTMARAMGPILLAAWWEATATRKQMMYFNNARFSSGKLCRRDLKRSM